MDSASMHRGEENEGREDPRLLGGEELDRRIRQGWEEWCDLLEGLVGSGGMLPSRDLAGRVVAYFESAYWRAEEARVEALRRQLTVYRRRDRGQVERSCGQVERSWGLG